LMDPSSFHCRPGVALKLSTLRLLYGLLMSRLFRAEYSVSDAKYCAGGTPGKVM
jgi:hypothetical protein